MIFLHGVLKAVFDTKYPVLYGSDGHCEHLADIRVFHILIPVEEGDGPVASPEAFDVLPYEILKLDL
jgi:hypothetical protein